MQTTKSSLTDNSSLSAKTVRKNRQNIWLIRLRRNGWTYLLLFPGMLYFLLFYYMPLLGNVVAFQDYSPYLGLFRSPWSGLDNFVSIFSDPAIGTVIINTLVISSLQILFAFPVGIVLSLMLNALIHDRFKRFM